jgi:hypothetical protein
MFQKIKEFLFGKLPAEQTPAVHVEAVPYKVEAPAVTPVPVAEALVVAEPVPVVPEPVVATPVEPARCGCGRSPTGLCVGLHKLTSAEWATHADNPSKPVAKETAPAKPARKPRAKPAAKPAAITPAKKSRGRKPAQK